MLGYIIHNNTPIPHILPNTFRISIAFFTQSDILCAIMTLSPDQITLALRIYAGNLPSAMNEEELRSLFTPYGQVEETEVVKDRQTGRSAGFGFVEMPFEPEARQAITALDRTLHGNNTLHVSEANPKPRYPISYRRRQQTRRRF